MILCFYRQELETFKENHKIIDVPFSSLWALERLSGLLMEICYLASGAVRYEVLVDD